MRRVYADRPLPAAWKRPSGVVEVEVDPATGRGLAKDCAPTLGNAYSELFLAGRQPRPVCPGKEGASRMASVLTGDEKTASDRTPADRVAPPKEKPALPPPVKAKRTTAEPEIAATAPRSERGANLSGWWEVTNQIQSTNYSAYQGLRLTYRIHLEQEGDRLVGKGLKSEENGRPLPASAQTPITLSGTIDGRTARLLFTERGSRRTTQGNFRFKIAPNGETLAGSFASGAADTSGPALARRAG
jgi:hypothetical protein